MMRFSKHSLLFLFSHIVLALVFAYFFQHLVMSDFHGFSLKKRNLTTGEFAFRLPAAGEYSLKVWCRGIPSDARINGAPLTHSFFRAREKLNEFYYVLDYPKTREGDNRLSLTVPANYSLLIKNNFAVSEFGGIFFRSTSPGRHRPQVLIFTVFFAGLCLYGFFLRWLLRYFFGLEFRSGILAAYIVGFFPAAFLLLLCRLFSMYSPLRLYFFIPGFVSLFLIITLASHTFLLTGCRFLYRYATDRWEGNRSALAGKAETTRTSRATRLLSGQQPSDRPILLFLVFLALGVVCLAARLTVLSEIFSDIGLVLLFVGTYRKIKEAIPGWRVKG